MEDDKLIPKGYLGDEEISPIKEKTPPPVSPAPSSFERSEKQGSSFESPLVSELKTKINLIANKIQNIFGGVSLVTKIIIGAFLVLILGTGAALATGIWDPIWNPFRPEAEKVITKMAEKMRDVKTSHLQMDFGISIKNETAADIVMKMEADSDKNDSNNLKSAGNISLNLSLLWG